MKEKNNLPEQPEINLPTDLSNIGAKVINGRVPSGGQIQTSATIPVAGDTSSASRFEAIIQNILNNFAIINSGINTGLLANNAVTSSKIANSAVNTNDLASESVTEQKLDIHNSPSTNQVLAYTSNGMEWVSLENLLISLYRTVTWNATVVGGTTGFTVGRSVAAFSAGPLIVYYARVDISKTDGTAWRTANTILSFPVTGTINIGQQGLFVARSPLLTGDVETIANGIQVTFTKGSSSTLAVEADCLGLYLSL